MKKYDLIEYIKHGREIEFKYNNKMYSITYYPDGSEYSISFCEFYKDPIDVKTIDELININVHGKTVVQILESLSEANIWIY
ncbi:MAG: hypothetical protein MJ146_02790 [Clostridia bacterium]|nr:hypothetical protein [Clostridia bacterium]